MPSTWKIASIAVLLAMGTAFTLYRLNNPSSTYRFRLAVKIQTTSGPKEASSIIEVKVRQVNWGTPESKGIKREVRGEAVFVSLDRGENIVATMTTGDMGSNPDAFSRIAERSFEATFGRYPSFEELSQSSETVVVPRNILPTFVRFINVDDAFSGKVIVPDEFSSEYGKDVRLDRVTITFVREPFQSTILKNLPFLKKDDRQTRNRYSTYPPKFQPQPYYFIRK